MVAGHDYFPRFQNRDPTGWLERLAGFINDDRIIGSLPDGIMIRPNKRSCYYIGPRQYIIDNVLFCFFYLGRNLPCLGEKRLVRARLYRNFVYTCVRDRGIRKPVSSAFGSPS